MLQVPLLAAVMVGALFTPACTDCCECNCWWSTLAARPVEPWAILTCRRLTTTAIIVFVPLKQLVLFLECRYYLLGCLCATRVCVPPVRSDARMNICSLSTSSNEAMKNSLGISAPKALTRLRYVMHSLRDLPCSVRFVSQHLAFGTGRTPLCP